MAQLDAEELYARSRSLFIDLLKLGLSLSTGVVAALSIIVLDHKDNGTQYTFTPFQKDSYYWCLGLLAFSILSALVGWASQAMYYTAWAADKGKGIADEVPGRKKKWNKIRNASIWLFIGLFVTGILAAALLICSFVKTRI